MCLEAFVAHVWDGNYTYFLILILLYYVGNNIQEWSETNECYCSFYQNISLNQNDWDTVKTCIWFMSKKFIEVVSPDNK